MTLTDFLLARIAEDEASAINWLRFEVRDGIPGNYAIPNRIHAECEAKRRIVERYEAMMAEANAMTVDDPSFWRALAGETRLAMLDLATAYADHPDYREEWRP